MQQNKGLELATVLQQHWKKIEKQHINTWQLRTLSAIKNCRTAALGGHKDCCTNCGEVRISYNSCRNRHCPKCQGNAREKWIQKRNEELLPVPYFHVVFTLPDVLNTLAMHQPKLVYDTLFAAAWQTIDTFANDNKHLGATPGMISILHTWGQQLTLHPHLHCIVPGGGLSAAGFWKHPTKSKDKFLFPVKAMSNVFRAKYVSVLKQKITIKDKEFWNNLFAKDWVVFAKRPFGNATSVVEYLGRYTHKIAISNNRIKCIDKNTVTFSYKDYRKEAAKAELTIDAMEFVRRFCLHILPKGFVRIRHYGILSTTSKRKTIPIIKAQIDTKKHLPTELRILKNYNPKMCTCCNTETMVTIEILTKRGPPNLQTRIKMKVNKMKENKN